MIWVNRFLWVVVVSEIAVAVGMWGHLQGWSRLMVALPVAAAVLSGLAALRLPNGVR